MNPPPDRLWRMSLDFGPAVLTLPARLSVEDIDDLEEWLGIVARQTRRMAEREFVGPPALLTSESPPA